MVPQKALCALVLALVHVENSLHSHLRDIIGLSDGLSFVGVHLEHPLSDQLVLDRVAFPQVVLEAGLCESAGILDWFSAVDGLVR